MVVFSPHLAAALANIGGFGSRQPPRVSAFSVPDPYSQVAENKHFNCNQRPVDCGRIWPALSNLGSVSEKFLTLSPIVVAFITFSEYDGTTPENLPVSDDQKAWSVTLLQQIRPIKTVRLPAHVFPTKEKLLWHGTHTALLSSRLFSRTVPAHVVHFQLKA